MIIGYGQYDHYCSYENDPIGKNKRVIYTLDPETQKREVVGEWVFKDTNLDLCKVTF